MNGLSISLPMLILVLIMEKILKKEAMGGGDIKLIFVIGLYIGWEKSLLMLFVACVIGIIAGCIQMRKENENYIAFGPFLSAAAVISMLIGDGLIGWYLSLFI